MRIRNLAIALFLAVATFSTSAVISQNETSNDNLAFSNSKTILVADNDKEITKDIEGAWIPD
ncbi:MAG: hypothetical protein DRJ05_11560 [Bacteroidetes bacterium]|nr:MAG: hypothetical protein DRJ05_11560 [Bacteroidota bacterium]